MFAFDQLKFVFWASIKIRTKFSHNALMHQLKNSFRYAEISIIIVFAHWLP